MDSTPSWDQTNRIGVNRRVALLRLGGVVIGVAGAGALGSLLSASEALAKKSNCRRKDDDEAERQCKSKQRAKGKDRHKKEG